MDMETFDDISVMAGTLWGEARSEGEQGILKSISIHMILLTIILV